MPVKPHDLILGDYALVNWDKFQLWRFSSYKWGESPLISAMYAYLEGTDAGCKIIKVSDDFPAVLVEFRYSEFQDWVPLDCLHKAEKW